MSDASPNPLFSQENPPYRAPESREESAPLVPQTRRDICEPPPPQPVELANLDKLPLMVTSPEEQDILERHATSLTARLLGPDGQAELRQLLAKRVVTLDIEVQRLTALREIKLRGWSDQGMSPESYDKMASRAHRRFVATVELFQRVSGPRVRLTIGKAENVAVVTGERSE